VGEGVIAQQALTSVLIPSRDRPFELERALASALGQRGVELEVVVIDDGSEPPASEVVDRVGDGRVRTARLPGLGVAAARNAGLAAARGDRVAFLDDDDHWHPEKLRVQLEAMDATGTRWSWCSTSVVDRDGEQFEVRHAPAGSEIAAQLRLYNAVSGSASSVLADASLVREVGGFDEDLAHLADWDLWLKLAAAPGVGIDRVLVTQQMDPGGMHSQDTTGALREFAQLRDRHPDVRSRDFVRWVVAAHSRAGRRGQAARAYLSGWARYREWPGYGRFLIARSVFRKRQANAIRERGG
jgi:glycosyltransferase involved in cell wall biosynthesis